MRVAAFTPAETRVIEACRDAGIVIDFILIDCEGSDTRGDWTHRCAAISAVKAACEATAQQIRVNVDKLIGDDANREHELQQTAGDASVHWQRASAQEVDPATLHGRAITLRDLYGEAYDAEGGTFDETKARFAGEAFDPTWTLADAFTCTPYGLQAQGEPLRELWRRVVFELLGNPNEATAMFRWNGDWSPYFDAGREWWGAAAWTLARGERHVLVACASTTD